MRRHLYTGQSMKRKFLLILSGNHIAIALVNQYKWEGKNRGKTELTVSGKTSCPRHSWLEDVILLGLTSGNSTYAASSHPWSTIRRLGNYCVLSLDFDDFGRDYSPKFKKNLGVAACRY